MTNAVSIRTAPFILLFSLFLLTTQCQSPSPSQYQLILFINADSFLCSFCQYPMIKFNEIVKEIGGQKYTQGIVVNIKKNASISKKLILKQISVAIQSVNLSFPIILENEGELGMLQDENYILLVVNKKKKSTTWMKLPVEKKDILRLL